MTLKRTESLSFDTLYMPGQGLDSGPLRGVGHSYEHDVGPRCGLLVQGALDDRAGRESGHLLGPGADDHILSRQGQPQDQVPFRPGSRSCPDYWTCGRTSSSTVTPIAPCNSQGRKPSTNSLASSMDAMPFWARPGS